MLASAALGRRPGRAGVRTTCGDSRWGRRAPGLAQNEAAPHLRAHKCLSSCQIVGSEHSRFPFPTHFTSVRIDFDFTHNTRISARFGPEIGAVRRLKGYGARQEQRTCGDGSFRFGVCDDCHYGATGLANRASSSSTFCLISVNFKSRTLSGPTRRSANGNLIPSTTLYSS